MAKERLYLFDTTLRDGAQTNGVDFTLADKLAIAGMLDDLGIDYVEGGYPGANPPDTEFFAKDHGYGTTLPDPVGYLRDYRQRGGQVWVLDPRRTETAAHADEHLAVRPGSDVAVLAAVASAMLVDGFDEAELAEHCYPAQVEALRVALAPFTVERAAAAADVDADQIERLIAAVRANPGRLAAFCGTGTTMSRDGLVVEWLRWVLLILTGSLDRSGGMRFHDGLFPRPGPARPPRPDARPPRAGPASR